MIKFDSCNNLISSVHTMYVIVLRLCQFEIKYIHEKCFVLFGYGLDLSTDGEYIIDVWVDKWINDWIDRDQMNGCINVNGLEIRP